MILMCHDRNVSEKDFFNFFLNSKKNLKTIIK